MRRLLLIGALLPLGLASAALAQDRACRSDADCPRQEICTGDETTTRCVPGVCADVYDPVCGLDGDNYRNACEASLERVGVLYRGPCGRCGGLLGRQCGTDSFCDPDPGTCKPKGDGSCVARPPKCEPPHHPVCGCDGNTYANDCLRRMARVALWADGPCVGPLKTTKPRPTAPSLAAPVPAAPAPRGGAAAPAPPPPVSSHPAPAAVTPPGPASAASGSSDDQPRVCTSNRDCAASEFCRRQPGGCDQEGECQPRFSCEEESAVQGAAELPWQPVCGCDGVTYATACAAEAAGQSLACEQDCKACVP